MSIIVSIKCDICGSELPEAEARDKMVFARWGPGEKLQKTSDPTQGPVHICIKCLEAITAMHVGF